MKTLYSLRQVATQGLLPFKCPATIVKEIEAGRLKAIVRHEGVGKRYLISGSEIQKYNDKIGFIPF